MRRKGRRSIFSESQERRCSSTGNEGFLKRIYDGSIGMMMSALVNQNDLSKEDIRELREILEEAEQNVKEDNKRK